MAIIVTLPAIASFAAILRRWRRGADERLALAVSHRAIRELGDPGRCKLSARALRAVENAVTSSRVCVRQSAGDAQAMKDMARPRVSSRLL